MNDFKIYTCGRMKDISFEEQMQWRREIEKYISLLTDKKVTFIHPPLFYGYKKEFHKNEREVMDWELKQVCESDIVVVNLDKIMSSVGSHMELGAVCGAKLSSGRNISVIGIGQLEETLHPWLELCQLRHEKSIEDAAQYIARYLLI